MASCGAPPPSQPARNKSGRTVLCVKFQKELPGLDEPPWPGELGQRIYDQVSVDRSWWPSTWRISFSVRAPHYRPVIRRSGPSERRARGAPPRLLVQPSHHHDSVGPWRLSDHRRWPVALLRTSDVVSHRRLSVRRSELQRVRLLQDAPSGTVLGTERRPVDSTDEGIHYYNPALL
jgi:hypothetical protein